MSGPMTLFWIAIGNGKKIRLLTIIDEFSRECLSIRIDHQIKRDDVLDELSTKIELPPLEVPV